MSKIELRSCLALASIFATRMLGLFMILPIFSPYAMKLPHATPTLIGLALGIYGLTQACLQMPMGILSDRFGRKAIITLGLLVFAVGSVVCALSHRLLGIIIGRALQGAGAIGSTLMATVADVTAENHRTQAMALIGMTIGLSFGAAMVLGPLLNLKLGISGIFWFTSIIAISGIFLLRLVPLPSTEILKPRVALPQLIREVIQDRQLLRLNFGIFFQHAILTANFLVIPLHSSGNWWFFLPILIFAFIAMLPLVIIAEKKNQLKKFFLCAVTLTGITQWLLATGQFQSTHLPYLLFFYFTAFNFLEAALPSLISKISPPESKGTAMGIYSTFQFFGIFVGGYLGGICLSHFGSSGVFYATTFMATLWLVFGFSMAEPKRKLMLKNDFEPSKT